MYCKKLNNQIKGDKVDKIKRRFENSKGVIRSCKSKNTDKTMSLRKITK
jgi:hypothetical protein